VSPPRPPLSPERIVDAAVAVADAEGLAGVSMRRVGRELGVEAMSLYHHVEGKDALLDALVERVFTQIATPTVGAPWRAAMASRAESARAVLSAHPWGLGLIESRRNPGPALLADHDAVIGCLRAAGFSVALAAHAFSVLDAYVYGFVVTELNLPFEPDEGAEEYVAAIADVLDPAAFPHLTEMIGEQVVGGGYDYADEFGFGLTLILDGIERHHRAERS